MSYKKIENKRKSGCAQQELKVIPFKRKKKKKKKKH